jgi:hypothetical protein
MAAAQIAAAVLAFLPAALIAQETPLGHLTIQVTDLSGAVVPGARIEIDPSPSHHQFALVTDSNGEVIFGLKAGNHVLTVSALGFATWSEKIDIQDASDQQIVAKLRLATISGPPLVTPLTPEIDVIRPPEPAPLCPIEVDEILACYSCNNTSPRKHWWQRLPGH